MVTLGKARILVLEDELVTGESIKRILQKVGHEVHGPVANAVDGLALAEKVRPTLLIADIKIEGDRDGIETAQLIRKQYGSEIIYLTAVVSTHL